MTACAAGITVLHLHLDGGVRFDTDVDVALYVNLSTDVRATAAAAGYCTLNAFDAAVAHRVMRCLTSFIKINNVTTDACPYTVNIIVWLRVFVSLAC